MNMDDRLFRDAMGKFATGITVVTADYNNEIIGMTVNAFMSISLDPKLIAISIDENASMYDKLLEVKKFGVSILKEEQKEVSMIFAKQIEQEHEIDYHHQDGIPVIEKSLVTLSCHVKEMVSAGDHMIFIAEVSGIAINEGQPLIYASSKYQSLKSIE
jgi:flavin reductase (DIM6/NTAB) family NADH-FMN oxidoreductase RutF